MALILIEVRGLEFCRDHKTGHQTHFSSSTTKYFVAFHNSQSFLKDLVIFLYSLYIIMHFVLFIRRFMSMVYLLIIFELWLYTRMDNWWSGYMDHKICLNGEG